MPRKRHAQLYNRKVKNINISECSWPTGKIVVRRSSLDVTQEMHMYRVCVTVTGQKKVIHRNLLMLANFLPVEDTCEMSDPASSMPASDSSVAGTH